MSVGKIGVVFIVGSPKSFEQVLSKQFRELEQVFVLGDGSRFWEEFYSPTYYCTCGQKVCECSFWVSVNKRVADLQQSESNSGQIDSGSGNRSLPLSDKYAHFLKLISEESGCPVIVDLTMNPSQAARFRNNADFDVYIVHIEAPLWMVIRNWIHLLPLPTQPVSFVPMVMKPFLKVTEQWVFRKYKASRLRGSKSYIFIRGQGDEMPWAKNIVAAFGLVERLSRHSHKPAQTQHGIYKNEYDLSRVGIKSAPAVELPNWKMFIANAMDRLANLMMRS